MRINYIEFGLGLVLSLIGGGTVAINRSPLYQQSKDALFQVQVSEETAEVEAATLAASEGKAIQRYEAKCPLTPEGVQLTEGMTISNLSKGVICDRFGNTGGIKNSIVVDIATTTNTAVIEARLRKR